MARTNLNDFQDATEAIDALLEKYDEHKGSKWLRQGIRDQAVHVRGHLDDVTQMSREMPMVAFNFEDFVSLGCRGLMLLQHAIMKYPEEYEKWKKDAKAKNTMPKRPTEGGCPTED